MPKMKTRKASAKRFKVTGGGEVRRKRAGHGHLLTGKTRKRKRKLRTGTLVASSDKRRILRQIAS
jgi:large subunit ribosomal protein L35